MQTTKLDILLYWLLNVTSAFLLSAAHNALFYVLDVRAIVTHFLHHLVTFVFLFVTCAPCISVKIEPETLKKALLPPFLTQIAVSLVSSRVHSGNRTGSLYLLRITDFIVTLVALKVSPRLLGPSVRNRVQWSIMIPVALSASLCWLEFGQIEYDTIGLLLTPILAVLQGLNIVFIRRSIRIFVSSSVHATFELFALYFSGTVAVGLALPAFVSYLQRNITYDASWESIDYTLMTLSILFMAAYKFSDLWLLGHVDLPVYLCLEHTKYFMASIGQWFIQNMAHATVYAAVGKLLFVTSSLRFWQSNDPLPKKQSH
uniref:TPT domain-containing protein n=1 Tax=Panagrellus redivivus TaxID=6233 RepID=A0A7E5A2D1_PANRE